VSGHFGFPAVSDWVESGIGSFSGFELYQIGSGRISSHFRFWIISSRVGLG
jgi:hypothetical protein